MKHLLILVFLLSYYSSFSQTAVKLYNEDFKWTIGIPDEFMSLSPETWTSIQNEGALAVEDASGEAVKVRPTTIFVFKSGEYNYLESSFQPYDEKKQGNYAKAIQNANEVLLESIKMQIPDAVANISSGEEMIGGLKFYKSDLTMQLPNNLTIHYLTFNRLFEDRDLTINVVFDDSDKGSAMLEALKGSKFK